MRARFLDDDPLRASAFAADRPGMVWVQSAEDCLRLLAEPWEEVHLDHDLGGETFVDPDRDDCGMAVVLRLAEGGDEPLSATRIVVHTHNANAAYVMALHLEMMGLRAEIAPFGRRPIAAPSRPSNDTRRGGAWMRVLQWLGGRSA